MMGPHPCLILRLLEWVLGITDSRERHELLSVFFWRARNCARNHAGTPAGGLWLAVAALLSAGVAEVEYQPVPPERIVDATYFYESARQIERIEDVERFITRRQMREPPRRAHDPDWASTQSVVVVAGPNASKTDVSAIASRLAQAGCLVLEVRTGLPQVSMAATHVSVSLPRGWRSCAGLVSGMMFDTVLCVGDASWPTWLMASHKANVHSSRDVRPVLETINRAGHRTVLRERVVAICRTVLLFARRCSMRTAVVQAIE